MTTMLHSHRWTITGTTLKAAAPYAYDVWAYLFGMPAPTWKEWNDSERKYEFDAEGLATLVAQTLCAQGKDGGLGTVDIF